MAGTIGRLLASRALHATLWSTLEQCVGLRVHYSRAQYHARVTQSAFFAHTSDDGLWGCDLCHRHACSYSVRNIAFQTCYGGGGKRKPLTFDFFWGNDAKLHSFDFPQWSSGGDVGHLERAFRRSSLVSTR